MRKRVAQFVSVIVCFGVVGVSSARADSINITGGTLTATPGGPAVFTLTGDNGLLASAGTPDGLATAMFDCTPCTAANPAVLSFNGFTAGSPIFSGFPTEAAAYNGVSYPDTFLAGSMTLVGPNFSSAVLSPSNLVLTAPFTMVGTMTDFPTFEDTQTFASKNFNLFIDGSGTATAQFAASGPGAFSIERVTYAFGAGGSPSPTPEPASLVLFGVGLAGAVVRRKRVA